MGDDGTLMLAEIRGNGMLTAACLREMPKARAGQVEGIARDSDSTVDGGRLASAGWGGERISFVSW